jgi:Cd2+/Zn2+-exporting ATPase
VFLVVSCPCALVISIPLAYFGGIGRASKQGVLVKGGNFLDNLLPLDTVVFDKTGTLTKGTFRVVDTRPVNGVSSSALLACAASAEHASTHPIARAIAAVAPPCNTTTDFTEHPGRGVIARVANSVIAVGSAALLEEQGIAYKPAEGVGATVYVAKDGVFQGSITIADEIKPNAVSAIAALKARGVRKTVCLSGDEPRIVNAVATTLGVDEAHGGLLPADKMNHLEALENATQANGKLAFVGDGINDAPALARADIGIAMGALGSDAAIEAADVVIMNDEVEKVADAMDIARATHRIVWQNIAFALGVKAVVLALGAVGVATMWAAVFADVGVALLCVLNAMRLTLRR